MGLRNTGSFELRGVWFKKNVGGENATRSRVQLNIKTNEISCFFRNV